MKFRPYLMKCKYLVFIVVILFAAFQFLGCSSGDDDNVPADSGAGAPPAVDAGVVGSGPIMPGDTITVEATINDGSTLQSVTWTQSNSVDVVIDSPNTLSTTVNLPDLAAYKVELRKVLLEPPIAEEDLPPNVELPPGGFVGGLQDRFQVVGLNPFVLEETGLVTLEGTVVTSSGSYTVEVEIHATLPWEVTSSLNNVPLAGSGPPVFLNGKTQATYNWMITSAPTGSTATLIDATTQNPYLEPEVAGIYEVMEVVSGTTIRFHAGTWQGAISGQDGNGRPLSEGCTICHEPGGAAADQFTPWKETGHAEIFTNNLNTSTHYGESCFPCHTVGFNTGVNNGGADDAPDYDKFLAAGLINNPGDNWTTTLANFPATAQLANIQCENCHGPNLGNIHPTVGGAEERYSISSDVCAQCHGEPLRHARFQQWQLSGHANYEVAIDEGDSGNCSRCHTANGFLTWLPVLLDTTATEAERLANVTVTWTTDEVHPQTCTSCHDPHQIGTTSGNNTNATVRVSDDTPPLIAGFTATDVGRGAICMTCHNSRRGLRNDSTFDSFSTGERARGPHGSAQADMLMGQNGYLVTVGTRGNHSITDNVKDTCAGCHMEQTPPPDLLSYNQGGSNHTFFAGEDICAECHTTFTAADIQNSITDSLDELQKLIEAAYLQLIADQIAAGNTIDLDGNGTTDIDDVADIKPQPDGIVFSEFRGRQALTITFTDDTVSGPHQLQNIDLLNGVDGPKVTLGEFSAKGVAPDNLIKAGWNYILVNNDSSKGIHNFAFASNVLQTSLDAVNAL